MGNPKPRTRRRIQWLLGITGMIALAGFVWWRTEAASMDSRFVIIEEWTPTIHVAHFWCTQSHMRSFSAIREDICDRRKPEFIDEDSVCTCFWLYGVGVTNSHGDRIYRMGKDGGPITYGFPHQDVRAVVLNETANRSWWEGTVDSCREASSYTFYQEAPCTFIHMELTNLVEVTSWNDFLEKSANGRIMLGVGGPGHFYPGGDVIHLRGRMVRKADAGNENAVLELAGHPLVLNLSAAFREDVNVLGHASETEGCIYDIWGYFFVKTSVSETAQFEAILCVPVAHEQLTIP